MPSGNVPLGASRTSRSVQCCAGPVTNLCSEFQPIQCSLFLDEPRDARQPPQGWRLVAHPASRCSNGPIGEPCQQTGVGGFDRVERGAMFRAMNNRNVSAHCSCHGHFLRQWREVMLCRDHQRPALKLIQPLDGGPALQCLCHTEVDFWSQPAYHLGSAFAQHSLSGQWKQPCSRQPCSASYPRQSDKNRRHSGLKPLPPIVDSIRQQCVDHRQASHTARTL
jgi:hypothetical protein